MIPRRGGYAGASASIPHAAALLLSLSLYWQGR
jgi:hypothetical protein